MSFLKELFGTEYPIIGLLHLKPLPGDPFQAPGSTLDGTIEAAAADLAALQNGGVDGVLVTNEFSLPYQQHVSPVTLAAMGTVIGAVRSSFAVPFGAEAIFDGDATIDLCAATGAAFTRCLFTDAWVGDIGIVNRDIASTLRRKFALRLDDLKLFYFATTEGDINLGGRSTADVVRTLKRTVHPDALVVGGSAAGTAPVLDQFDELDSIAGDVPLVCGTGCKASTVADVFAVAHGAFVGTSLKVDGKIENPVDLQRVRQLMDVARSVRGDK